MIQRLAKGKNNVLACRLSGKLHDDDYKDFVPVVDALVQLYGTVRLLALFEDFHGWDLQALWDDVKFTTTHCLDVERIALVGDQRWEEWMAKICKPFTAAKVRHFDMADLESAWSWIEEP